MLKNLKYIIEYIPLKVFYLICSFLPLEKASSFGARLVSFIGPFLKKSKIAKTQIRERLPHLSEEDINRHIKDMWRNLGRVLAEYPHLRTLTDPKNKYVEFHDPHGVMDALKQGQKTFFFSAHMANWDLLQSFVYMHFNESFTGIYRAPNNPYARKLLAKMRQVAPHLETIAKSSKGARDLIKHMQDGKHIGLLVDQKYNQGMAVPFLGQEAMTSTSFISLCQKYEYQLVPSHLVRIEECHFKLTLEKPIQLFNEKESKRNEYDVMCEIHGHVESWIKQNPAQWIWMHRRWG